MKKQTTPNWIANYRKLLNICVGQFSGLLTAITIRKWRMTDKSFATAVKLLFDTNACGNTTRTHILASNQGLGEELRKRQEALSNASLAFGTTPHTDDQSAIAQCAAKIALQSENIINFLDTIPAYICEQPQKNDRSHSRGYPHDEEAVTILEEAARRYTKTSRYGNTNAKMSAVFDDIIEAGGIGRAQSDKRKTLDRLLLGKIKNGRREHSTPQPQIDITAKWGRRLSAYMLDKGITRTPHKEK